MEGDLGWPLRRSARLFPKKIAVRDGDVALTYADLARRVGALGGGLDRLGVDRGKRLGYLGVNSLPHLECAVGVPAHARVLVDLNFRLSLEELATIIEDAEVTALVVDRDNLKVGRKLRDRCACLRELVLAAPVSESDTVAYEELVSGAPVEGGPPKSDQPALISYTGGTTGRPKGVVLSHGNLLANARHNLIVTKHAESDTMIHPCPMFHAAGLANVFASLWVGAENVIIPRFDPALMVEAIEGHGVTLAILVPTMIGMLLDYLEEFGGDLSSLRNLQYAASPISPELQRRAVETLPCELAQFYGMTEAAPTVTHLSPQQHSRGIAGEEPYRSRLASVGVPVPGVEAEVHRPDGREAAVGEVGEVWVRGPNVMLGYWNRPEETAQVLVDGWLRSGDAAFVDEDGFLHLVDRIKDMIVSGGENVYSVEVERVLHTHLAVREAAVFGIPDARWGETVHAIVVVDPEQASVDEATIIEHCRDRLAGFKIPRSVELRSTRLPTSGAGKVLKAELRQEFWPDGVRRIG